MIFQNTSRRKRERQTRYLSQAVQLEESVNPYIVKSTMSVVSVAVIAFVVWAGFANVHEVARAPGEVVPHGYQQTVQHLEGGIVASIDVEEGQIVEKGQVLLTLDGSSLQKDLERLRSKQLTLELQEERLRAFTEGREIYLESGEAIDPSIARDQQMFFVGMRDAREKERAVMKDQVVQKQQAIKSLLSDIQTANSSYVIEEDLYLRRKELNQKGYTSDVRLLESKQKLNTIKGEINRLKNQLTIARKELAEYELRLLSLTAQHHDEAYERLDRVIAEREQNKEVIAKVQERMARLEVKAPAKGLIKGIGVNTIGAVVQPGQTLMEVVPLGKRLEVQTKISPQDVGHLRVGQPVQVKLSAFDFSRYGSVSGELEYISATTFNGENGERYYQGRIVLNQNYVGHNPDNLIIPGMTVMADIITGDKTILQYLLKPIHISLKTAFTER